ncbi:chromosome partitioning protein ParB [Leptospira andrefontaineae]|uniref:chromosome partitioning protein ParB n=1 Tax=Leptospira andrefontaineae TaxID=2484976 RepID=UPI001FCA48D5|nr:chromosome partitioning protein ParB [Leptospira andrefontaineae]
MEELRQSIELNGILHAVYLRMDYTIISGRNRGTIASEKGILVPTIRFQKELPQEVEQRLIYHLNLVGRQVSPSERRAMVYKRFKDSIGKHGALSSIHKITGIHMSTLKQYSVDFQNKRRFKAEEVPKKRFQEKIEKYNRWKILLEKENNIKNERQKLQYELEKVAPISFWKSEEWKKS